MQLGPYFVSVEELEWSFGPAGGPGGQHANRSHTRATLRFDLGRSPAVPEAVKAHMLARLGARATAGVLSVTVDETRSQRANREIALERMRQILIEAMHRPRRRKPTRPTAASRERRLEEKRRRSARKAERRARFD